MKKSQILRVPEELVERIRQYEKSLPVRMGKADVMRNFANDAITPIESVGDAMQRLNNASKKKW